MKRKSAAGKRQLKRGIAFGVKEFVKEIENSSSAKYVIVSNSNSTNIDLCYKSSFNLVGQSDRICELLQAEMPESVSASKNKSEVVAEIDNNQIIKKDI